MKNKIKKNALGGLFVITLLLLNINCTKQDSKASNQKVVEAVYTAYEKKDWNMLTSLFADGFTFTSPMDDHIDLKEYKVRCWPNAYNIKKFDIEKLVADGDDIYVTYSGLTNDDRKFQNTEYFVLKDGKIKAFTCFFGPGISFPNNTKK